jgi:hypothetical protein
MTALHVLLVFLGVLLLDVLFLGLADAWLIVTDRGSVSQLLRDVTFAYPCWTVVALVLIFVGQGWLALHLWGK